MKPIAWKPTGGFVWAYDSPHFPFIARDFYNRPFGDVLLRIGLVFWVVGIWFSEAWPFIQKK